MTDNAENVMVAVSITLVVCLILLPFLFGILSFWPLQKELTQWQTEAVEKGYAEPVWKDSKWQVQWKGAE